MSKYYTGLKKVKFYTGAVKDELDSADIPFKGLEADFDWDLGFDIELVLGYRLTCKSEAEFYGPRGKDGWGVERYREIVATNPKPFKIPVKDQGSSYSCVGQSLAYYIAVLNMIETGKYVEISARDIYAYINLPGGGAYLRDGIKLSVDRGIATEKLVFSYMGGNPPTEAFMIVEPLETEAIKTIRKVLQSKDYRVIPYSGDRIDQTAKAMIANFGVFFGVYGVNDNSWYSEFPKVPNRIDWAHAIYGGKCSLRDGKKYVGFLNSWSEDIGNNGWQAISEDYFNKYILINEGLAEFAVFNPWTLQDKSNNMTNVKIIKDSDSPAIYFAVEVASPEAFKSYCANYGIEVPLLEDNKSIDWGKVNIEGNLKLIN